MSPSRLAAGPFENAVTARMTAFIAAIGVPVIACAVIEPCFVPGIRLERGTLRVDESRLLYPGDLLHEAGHIAVMTPARRQARAGNASNTMGDEIAAIAWSWAALTFLGLAPAVVFHPRGYKGASAWFIETYGAGTYIGLPLLQWMGLALDPATAAKAGVAPYPHMLRWLRDA